MIHVVNITNMVAHTMGSSSEPVVPEIKRWLFYTMQNDMSYWVIP